MAQALINNLNTIQDSGILKNNTKNTDMVDFSKILDKKNADSSNIYTKSDILTNNDNLNDKELQDAIEDSAKDSLNESTLDLNIVQDETSSTEETPAQEENNDTITIIEDQTMFKDFNTLEDPTATLILQSQVQTVKFNLTEKTNSEDTEENEQQIDKPLTLEFKNFDSKNSKQTEFLSLNTKDLKQEKFEEIKTKNSIDKEIAEDLNIESVESNGTESSSQEGLMQNQTPQEQAVKLMIQGAGESSSNFDNTIQQSEKIKPTEISPSKIIEQISKQLEGLHNSSKVTIVLNPEKLGKINLHIFNTKDGLQAQFNVANQETKDLLMKGLNSLKENLLAQGIAVDSVSIKISESEEKDSTSDWTEQENSQSGNKQKQNPQKHKQDEKLFEQTMFEINNDKE